MGSLLVLLLTAAPADVAVLVGETLMRAPSPGAATHGGKPAMMLAEFIGGLALELKDRGGQPAPAAGRHGEVSFLHPALPRPRT